jgi:hypothetical protein
MSKRLAGSDQAVIGLTGIGQYGKYSYWTGFCRFGPMKVYDQICQYNTKTFIGPKRQKPVQYEYFPYCPIPVSPITA